MATTAACLALLLAPPGRMILVQSIFEEWKGWEGNGYHPKSRYLWAGRVTTSGLAMGCGPATG